MNCSSCGANLPYGAKACPLCGTPVAYNPQQIDPTVAAGPSYGGQSPTPPTAYGDYGGPPPPPPVQNQYGAPPPAQNQYGAPTVQNQYGGTPPPQNQYGGAPPMQPGVYGQPMQPMQPGGFGVPQQPPKKSNTGLIVGIVLGSILLVCVVIGIIVAVVLNNAGHAVVNAGNNIVATANAFSTQTSATLTAQPTVPGVTPTTGTGGTSPSGAAIDPTAAAIITNPQTASAIDSNSNPTTTASTFTVNQTIYVTFGLQLNGATGYVEVKWYVDGQVGTSKILTINDATFTHGYFSETYKVAATGAAELYWCSQSNCSDAALAQFVTFTVTATSSHSVIHPPIASAMDVNRPD